MEGGDRERQWQVLVGEWEVQCPHMSPPCMPPGSPREWPSHTSRRYELPGGGLPVSCTVSLSSKSFSCVFQDLTVPWPWTSRQGQGGSVVSGACGLRNPIWLGWAANTSLCLSLSFLSLLFFSFIHFIFSIEKIYSHPGKTKKKMRENGPISNITTAKKFKN